MLFYSVVFIKKISVLSLRHRCFPGKFTKFLEEQKRPVEMLCKKMFLEFRNISRKTFALESLFNKVVAGSCPQDLIFIKNRLQHRHFSVNIAEFLRTRILKNIYKELPFKKLF